MSWKRSGISCSRLGCPRLVYRPVSYRSGLGGRASVLQQIGRLNASPQPSGHHNSVCGGAACTLVGERPKAPSVSGVEAAGLHPHLRPGGRPAAASGSVSGRPLLLEAALSILVSGRPALFWLTTHRRRGGLRAALARDTEGRCMQAPPQQRGSAALRHTQRHACSFNARRRARLIGRGRLGISRYRYAGRPALGQAYS